MKEGLDYDPIKGLISPLQGAMDKDKDKEKEKEVINKSTFILPDWVPLETWKEFLVVRKKKKASTTDYAYGLIIKKLEQFKAKGHNAVDVLNKSITTKLMFL